MRVPTNISLYDLGNLYACIIVPLWKQVKHYLCPFSYFVTLHKKGCIFLGTSYDNAVLSNIDRLCKNCSPAVSISKMCDDLKLSRSLITKLKENPERKISGTTAIKIADYFGVSVDCILGTEAKKQHPVSEELSDAKKQLIQYAYSLTDEQAALALRILKSVLEAAE